MPQKTIYVKEEDLPILEEAMSWGEDSLSGVIVESLKEFLAKKKTFDREKKEWVLDVGSKKIAFVAQRVLETKFPKYQTAKHLETRSSFGGLRTETVEKERQLPRFEKWQIFLSEKGNYLIWWEIEDEKDYCIVDSIKRNLQNVTGKVLGKKVSFSIREKLLAHLSEKSDVSHEQIETLEF